MAKPSFSARGIFRWVRDGVLWDDWFEPYIWKPLKDKIGPPLSAFLLSGGFGGGATTVVTSIKSAPWWVPLMAALGFGILGALVALWMQRRSPQSPSTEESSDPPDLDDEPGRGSEVDYFIRVTNMGGRAKVKALATVVEDKYGQLSRRPYLMKWADTGTGEAEIGYAKSALLLVAEVKPFDAGLDTPAELDHSIPIEDWYHIATLVTAEGNEGEDQQRGWIPNGKEPSGWTLTILVELTADPPTLLRSQRRYRISTVPKIPKLELARL